nr:hypothetical protein [Nocardia brasiliensis]
MTARKRFKTTNVESRMYPRKNTHANGFSAITSRAMSGHASPVMIWNSVHMEVPRLPKYSGVTDPNNLVAIAAATYNTNASSPRIEPIPGSAASRFVTTRRILGVADTNRSARRIRNARNTDKPPEAGSSATPTTAKSKQFHGSRKYSRP